MFLGRLLVLLALAGVAWFAWRALRRYLQAPERSVPPAQPQPVKMLRCAHCGVYVASQEAVRDRDAAFCCEEHRRLGAKP